MKVRLRLKLTLAFLILNIVTLATTFGVLTYQVRDQYQRWFDQRRAMAERAVRKGLDQMAADVAAALRRLQSDPMIEELSGDLRHGVFYGDQQRERTLVKGAEQLMVAPQFDVLRIVDAAAGGKVLAIGHRRGADPPDGRIVDFVRRYPGRFLLRPETVQQSGDSATRKWLTLQVAHLVAERVVLVAGRRLDQDFLQRVANGVGDNVQLTIADPDGQMVSHTFGKQTIPRADDPDWQQTTLSLSNPDAPQERATLTVFVATTLLRESLAALAQLALITGGAGLLFALLLGWVLARTITRPLQRLVAGAERVANGDLDHPIAVSSHDEVGELVARFNRMTAEVKSSRERLVVAERMAAWKDIARQIAHEIKNPLFPIQTAIETVRKAHARQHPRFAEILEEATRTTLEEVERLKRIVNEFSAFARMPKPRLRMCDLNEIIRSTVALYAGSAARTAIECQLADDLPLVALDADLISQALANLAKNALQAVAERPDGQVVVRTTRLAADRVRIDVEDNGPGIAAEDRTRVFEPYFTRKIDGTGLGLAIVYRTVLEHGGQIVAEAGRALPGALLSLELPVRTKAALEAQVDPSPA